MFRTPDSDEETAQADGSPSFAQSCSRSIIETFVHIWHPQALDTFDDYINSKVGFSNSEANSSQFWITSITIPHWILKPKDLSNDPLRTFHDKRKLRKHGQIPPQRVLENRNLGKPTGWLGKLLSPGGSASETVGAEELEERVSSVVVTGDHLGNFWICSVLSPSVKEETMSPRVEEVHNTMKLFLHCPSAGRRLAFVLLVGQVCTDIAREYADIVKFLEKVLEEKVSDWSFHISVAP